MVVAPPRQLTAAERARAESLGAIAVLIALTAIAPLAIDMFLPSMPTMAEEFGVPNSTMQLAVTLFLLAFAASQLVYGPTSDRFGRRPVLIAGLLMFIAGGALALFAASAEMLVAGRIIQGLGGGAGPALGRAMVLDIFGPSRATRIISYMTIVTPLAPAIAPIIGGLLQDFFDWRAVFVTLIAIGVVLLVGYRALLPETNRSRDRSALGALQMGRNYSALLSSRIFFAYALMGGLMFSGQLVFISGSSFVLIDELGLSAGMFGVSFGFVAVGIMCGAWLSGRLVGRWLNARIVLLGSALAATAGTAMVLLAWADIANAWAVIGPMFLVAGGFGIARPPAMAGALIPFPQMAGLASAVLGFSQMAVATLYNITFSTVVPVNQAALATGVAAAATTSLVALLLLRPHDPAPAPAAAQS